MELRIEKRQQPKWKTEECTVMPCIHANSNIRSVGCSSSSSSATLAVVGSEKCMKKFIPFTISISNTHTNLLATWLVYIRYNVAISHSISRHANEQKKYFERTSLPMLPETEPFHTILKVYSVNSFENALCFHSLPVTRAHFFPLRWLLSLPGAQVDFVCLCIWNFRKQNAM